MAQLMILADRRYIAGMIAEARKAQAARALILGALTAAVAILLLRKEQ